MRWRKLRVEYCSKANVYGLMACFVCGSPLLFVSEHVAIAAAAWAALLIVYCCLLMVFGAGFVIEGAVIIFLLAVVATILVSAVSRVHGAMVSTGTSLVDRNCAAGWVSDDIHCSRTVRTLNEAAPHEADTALEFQYLVQGVLHRGGPQARPSEHFFRPEALAQFAYQ